MSKRKLRGLDKQKGELTPMRFFVRTGIFALVFFFVYALITLISSLFMYRTHNPTQNIYLCSLICGVVSSLIIGFSISKYNGEKWLLSGLSLGGILAITLLLTNIFIRNETNNYIHCILVLVFCILGAFLGRKRIHIKRKEHR